MRIVEFEEFISQIDCILKRNYLQNSNSIYRFKNNKQKHKNDVELHRKCNTKD